MAYRLNADSKRRLVFGAGIAFLALVLSYIPIVVFPQYGHLAILVIAVALISVGALQYFQYTRAGRWVPVKATVLDIREKCIDVVLHYNALKYYYPEICYKYNFQGGSHTSSSVSFDVENIWVPEVDSWGMKTDNTSKFWHEWKEGAIITAYVNHKNPNESVIINKVSKKAKSQQMALVVGGVMIGFLWLYVVSL